jgi:hypothetical protein
MQKLFENWRRYVNESTEPDHLSDEAELSVHPEASVGQPEEEEEGDEEKIFNAFLDNGAHGLHLAEMIGSPIVEELKDIIQDARNYISVIEDPENAVLEAWRTGRSRGSGSRPEHHLNNLLDWHARSVVSGIFNSAEKFFGDREALKMADNFEEMVVEAGDYAWWHGKYANMSPTYNIASKERSADLLNDLKEWAGV